MLLSYVGAAAALWVAFNILLVIARLRQVALQQSASAD
jgi:hypothetical protein